MIRLGVVDDHPVFRLGVRRSLERERDMAVVWEAGAASDVPRLLRSLPVDVVLMDLNLGPGQDALATTRSLRQLDDHVKVIVLSASLELEAAAAARTAGAAGYLPKDLSIADMVAAIRALAGQRTGRIEFKDMLRAVPRDPGSWAHRQGLTKREQEVLNLLRSGHTNREIAERLDVSITTINKHVQQVLKKLHVRTRAQAVARLHTEDAPRLYQAGDRSL